MQSHYFTAGEGPAPRPRVYGYVYNGIDFTFQTDSGIFSPGHMDGNTDLLIRSMPALCGSFLDMGCGCGCVGIVMAKAYSLVLTQVDINPRAAALAASNAKTNGVASVVVVSDGFAGVSGSFDAIAINPPIHAGKASVYRLYEGANRHLNPGGRLYVVILKKHGADSTYRKLIELFGYCEVIYKKKGRCVFCCVSNNMC